MATSAFDIDVRVSGDTSLETALRNAAQTVVLADTGETAPDKIIAATQTDYRSILGALYKRGFYGPSISIKVDGREASGLSLISLPRQVARVRISVDTGPQFSFGETTIGPLARGTKLPAEFATGEIARAPEVGAAKDAAIEAWRAASHAKAALASQSIVADHPRKRLDVAMSLAPGPAVVFGRLYTAGETVVSERRLRKIAGLPQGAPFSPEDLDRAAQRLRRTGAFKSVAIAEADELRAGNTLDITATVVEQTPRRYGFGAEFSSLEGGTISGYWMHRNFTRNADRFRVDAEVSGLGGSTGTDYRLGLSYRRPASFHAKYTAVLRADVEKIEDPNFSSRTGEFTFGVDIEASRLSALEAGVGYRYSDVEDALGRRIFRHIIFPIEGSRDARDDSLNATRGTYLGASILPFIGVSGSQSGLRLAADWRGYKSFGDDAGLVLAGRLNLGSILGAAGADVPSDMLFYSGGGGSVRGQPYQSLGVSTGGGTTGGTGHIGLSTELRGQINDKFGVVGFVDAGAIGADALPGKDARWHAGAGLGVRYATPVGPIRLDIAAPIAGDTGDGVQLYVGIGQAF